MAFLLALPCGRNDPHVPTAGVGIAWVMIIIPCVYTFVSTILLSLPAVETWSGMETLTIRDFRNNMASSLNIVDAGGSVYIRRRNKTYAVVLVDEDDLSISPALQAKIDQARQNFRDGKCVTVKTHEELDAYLDSL